MSGPDPAVIAANLARVRARIADAGGDPGTVVVVGMAKGQPRSVVDAATAAGLRDLGENYAQELRSKIGAGGLPEDLRWHFVGRLQSNKVRLVARDVWCWHSVDREVLVDEIARRAAGARVLIQVNASGETAKGGAAPDRVPALVARARDRGLAVTGIMAVGVEGDRAATARAFDVAARLADRLALPDRSMGMTADLDLAVRAGATMVRVGTGLFGPRPATVGAP